MSSPRWPKGRRNHRTFRNASLQPFSPPARLPTLQPTCDSDSQRRDLRSPGVVGTISSPGRNCRPGWRAPSPGFSRFAWGREKKKRERDQTPCFVPAISLARSLSAPSLSLLTGCRTRRAGQSCHHGDEEEGARHFREKVLPGLSDDGGVAAAATMTSEIK